MVMSAPISRDVVEAMLESRAKAVLVPVTTLEGRDPDGESLHRGCLHPRLRRCACLDDMKADCSVLRGCAARAEATTFFEAFYAALYKGNTLLRSVRVAEDTVPALRDAFLLHHMQVLQIQPPRLPCIIQLLAAARIYACPFSSISCT